MAGSSELRVYPSLLHERRDLAGLFLHRGSFGFHARRQIESYLLREAVAKKVSSTIAPRFADRKGGYSRIIKLGNRKGDGADLAIIELLGSELEVKKAEKAEKAQGKESKKGKAEKEEKED